MYKYILPLLLWLMVLPVQAHETHDILVDRIWAITDDEGVTAVFMGVNNTYGDHPIALIGASSLQADDVSLMADDESVDRIVIPTDEYVDFTEAGYMIAVMLHEEHEGPFTLTLTFNMLDHDLHESDESMNVIIGVPLLEESPEASDIVVAMPWARPTAMGMTMNHEHEAETHHHGDDATMSAPMFPTAVFLSLFNQGETADRLIGVSTPAAEIVEIHETRLVNDVMSMTPTDGIDLPVGEWVELAPGGYHIMLVNLLHELYDGEAIMLTLTFESGKELTLAVPVYDAMMMMDESSH